MDFASTARTVGRVRFGQLFALGQPSCSNASKMELFVARADGSNAKQITSNGAPNFCPYFMPDGKRVIYASNMLDPRGREFDIFIINKDGRGEPERITTAPAFDGFLMFSPDGQWLVWASNRANPEGRETNLFIARWVD